MLTDKFIKYEIIDIIKDLKKNNFNEALKKIKPIYKKHPNDYVVIKILGSIYLNLRNYENSIKFNKKLLNFNKDNFKVYNNIGTCLFQLGQINKSIDAFERSLSAKPTLNSYFNLGIAYEEIGKYEKALENYIYVLKINSSNYLAKKYLINILNFYKIENHNGNQFLETDFKIKQTYDKYKENELYVTDNIVRILKDCINILDNLNKYLYIDETQILRRNSKNLNCKRHLKVFETHNIIPKFCFSCYKVQISLFKIIDLIKLYFIFDNINLANNNIRKCMVETRKNIKVNYKGYIYCKNLKESQEILKQINLILKDKNISNYNTEIKHGCSEYYNNYPNFKKINFNGKQEMEYKSHWEEMEKIIDKETITRKLEDQKIFGTSLRGMNLYDILVIKNWLFYAKKIGDNSINQISNYKIDFPQLEKSLEYQINFRRQELLVN